MTKKFPKIIGIIPARFDSKRFPGKPLAMINGKSLIQRTYENAKKCLSFDELIVATDDQKIFDHIISFSGQVIMTSKDCPTGTDRLVEVVKNEARFNDVDIVVNIQGDEPCLDTQAIEEVIGILAASPEAVMSTAVTKLSPEDAYNSSVIKCVKDKLNNALWFSRALIPAGKDLTYNPKVHYLKHLGIYAFKRDFLLQFASLEPTPAQIAEDLEQLKVLEHGYKIKVALVDSESIGVDNPEDIQKVELFLCKQNTSS